MSWPRPGQQVRCFNHVLSTLLLRLDPPEECGWKEMGGQSQTLRQSHIHLQDLLFGPQDSSCLESGG